MEPDERLLTVPDGFFKPEVSYLRDIQYATTVNLDARVALHAKYSTAEQKWFDWLVDQVDWSNSHQVLEVGCGTGLFWTHVPPSVGNHLALTLTDLSKTMVDTALTRV